MHDDPLHWGLPLLRDDLLTRRDVDGALRVRRLDRPLEHRDRRGLLVVADLDDELRALDRRRDRRRLDAAVVLRRAAREVVGPRDRLEESGLAAGRRLDLDLA